MTVGIDVGGTFTDIACRTSPASCRTAKIRSLTDAGSQVAAQAVVSGVTGVLGATGHVLADVDRIEHATTMATNAIIERRGAPTALVTTEGFRDILEAGHETLYELYNFDISLPAPLVPRRDRLPFTERTAADGSCRTAPSTEAMAGLVRTISAGGYRSTAVCFVNSPKNAGNERQVAAFLGERLEDHAISTSAAVLPETDEYVRFSSTVIDAYVKPLVASYLRALVEALAAGGFRGDLGITLSDGTSTGWRGAAAVPVRMVESGPAAGVVAVRALRRRRAVGQAALAFDMGGTTAKLSFLRSDRPVLSADLEVARVSRFRPGSGLPIGLPSVDLLEIGAGGGSIAAVGDDGLLTIGPDSAGSAPGPACYGLGGDRPTVTDAAVVLGYLLPQALSPALTLDPTAAERAIAEGLARLDTTPLGAAEAVHRVVCENMAQAARVAAAERGLDCREFDLVALGGAGPMHAAAVARILDIGHVVVPSGAGVLSSLGCLVAPRTSAFVVPVLATVEDVDWERVRGEVAARLGRSAGGRDGEPADSAALPGGVVVHAVMRYAGQRRNRVTVPVPADLGSWLVGDGPDEWPPVGSLRQAFRRTYRARFGDLAPDREEEVVNLDVRLEAAGTPTLPAVDPGRPGSAPPLPAESVLQFESFGRCTGWVRRRSALPPAGLPGPGLVVDADTTVVVPPDFSVVAVDDCLDLARQA